MIKLGNLDRTEENIKKGEDWIRQNQDHEKYLYAILFLDRLKNRDYASFADCIRHNEKILNLFIEISKTRKSKMDREVIHYLSGLILKLRGVSNVFS